MKVIYSTILLSVWMYWFIMLTKFFSIIWFFNFIIFSYWILYIFLLLLEYKKYSLKYLAIWIIPALISIYLWYLWIFNWSYIYILIWIVLIIIIWNSLKMNKSYILKEFEWFIEKTNDIEQDIIEISDIIEYYNLNKTWKLSTKTIENYRNNFKKFKVYLIINMLNQVLLLLWNKIWIELLEKINIKYKKILKSEDEKFFNDLVDNFTKWINYNINIGLFYKYMLNDDWISTDQLWILIWMIEKNIVNSTQKKVIKYYKQIGYNKFSND